MEITTVIPIGGKGTRLKEVIGNVPKPIFPICGKSTLFRACEILLSQGLKKVIITLGFESKQCIEHISYIRDAMDIKIDIYQEKEPLGESGALWKVKEDLSQDFLFINGDLIFSVDFSRIISFHKRLDSDLTLVTHTSEHPLDSDLVSSPNGANIERIYLKNQKRNHPIHSYLGFSAIAFIKKKVVLDIPSPSNIQSSSLFHHLVNEAFVKKYKIYSYNTTEYIKDMGTPSRFKEAQNAIKNNILEKQNYKNKQRALFIDRDNTIIKCKKGDYILTDNEIYYLKENIKKLSIISNDFSMVILITNQPQISMGLLSIGDLENINSKIINFCLQYSLKIDVVSFCPHHPHKGFPNEISLLKKDCFCRKPNPGMLLEQSFLRNIDLNKSLMIGDSSSDKDAAFNAGCKFSFINDL